MRDDAGRLCATSRVTIAVRDEQTPMNATNEQGKGRVLLVHRDHRPGRAPLVQRMAPTRPHARAVPARRHRVRPALGLVARVPRREGGERRSARPDPLRDPLSDDRTGRRARCASSWSSAASCTRNIGSTSIGAPCSRVRSRSSARRWRPASLDLGGRGAVPAQPRRVRRGAAHRVAGARSLDRWCEVDGVAGAWRFADAEHQITVAWLDDEPRGGRGRGCRIAAARCRVRGTVRDDHALAMGLVRRDVNRG